MNSSCVDFPKLHLSVYIPEHHHNQWQYRSFQIASVPKLCWSCSCISIAGILPSHTFILLLVHPFHVMPRDRGLFLGGRCCAGGSRGSTTLGLLVRHPTSSHQSYITFSPSDAIVTDLVNPAFGGARSTEDGRSCSVENSASLE